MDALINNKPNNSGTGANAGKNAGTNAGANANAVGKAGANANAVGKAGANAGKNAGANANEVGKAIVTLLNAAGISNASNADKKAVRNAVNGVVSKRNKGAVPNTGLLGHAARATQNVIATLTGTAAAPSSTGEGQEGASPSSAVGGRKHKSARKHSLRGAKKTKHTVRKVHRGPRGGKYVVVKGQKRYL